MVKNGYALTHSLQSPRQVCSMHAIIKLTHDRKPLKACIRIYSHTVVLYYSITILPMAKTEEDTEQS